jgi:outer membrane protein TolC
MIQGFRIRRHLRIAAAATAIVASCAIPAASQYSAGMNGVESPIQSLALSQAGTLSGSVPSGPATDQVLHLTLQDAIRRGLQYNLGSIETSADESTARGQRLLALSNLLPHVNAAVSENVEQNDLATLGLRVPGIPKVIGPYSYSSADLSASQTLFSFESIQRLRAARSADQAAQLNYGDTLDAITLTVGNAYLQTIADQSRIEAQEAQVSNARALYQQAQDELQAGTAPRIDVTQTEVQLHTEEYDLSVARNNFAIAKLALARAIGLPLGQQFDLVDKLPYSDLESLSLDEALNTANTTRGDLHAALDSEQSAERALSAAKAERWPTLAVNGDYGDVGSTFGRSHGTFSFAAGVNVPVFSGRRIKGDIVEAQATLQQRKAEAENLRGQIDYDVRTAFLNLNAAREQVTVAKQNVALANENLARAKDRFTSGVTNSVEVVQAEQALASANDQYITSLYDHNLAKLSLARALGVAHTRYQQYLGGN